VPLNSCAWRYREFFYLTLSGLNYFLIYFSILFFVIFFLILAIPIPRDPTYLWTANLQLHEEGWSAVLTLPKWGLVALPC
jgi:hypothetical protein